MAYDFDGTDDHIEFNSSAGFVNPTAMSVSVWFNPDLSTFDDEVITQRTSAAGNEGWRIFATNNGITAVVDYGAGTVTSSYSVTVSNGQWWNAVWTFEASSATGSNLYINGVLRDTDDASSATDAGNPGSPLAIGYRELNGDREWDGQIAEAAIWNVTLDAGEAAALASYSPLLVRPEGLHWYWSGKDGLIDPIGGLTGSLDGTAPAQTSEHPNIMLPSTYKVQTYPPLVAAAQVPPKFYHHRHHNMAA